ncbi:MAG: amidohydrolase [Chloroflexi bacterium]|nr:amidohydrolase [Chloroflexota bacterium]
MPVIDFHLHITSYEGYRQSVVELVERAQGIDLNTFLARDMTPEGLTRILRASGVDYGVGLAEYNPMVSGVSSNEFVADFCQRTDRLIPFAGVNPYLMANPARELEKAVRELGCRGVKLFPTYQHFYPNENNIYPIYAKAEELGIPVMLHTGSSVFKGTKLKYGDPLFLDDVAVDFPNLTIVQAHSGRGFWYDRAFFLTRLHQNVYMEISGLPPQSVLRHFPDLERVADRVIFGSDWPAIASIGKNIEAIRQLPLNESTKKKILGENAARILRLPLIPEGVGG